jgi:hypothetical protein
MSNPDALQIAISVGHSADESELEALALELEDELRELEVDSVMPATGKAVAGSRGDPITLGVLLVKVGPVAIQAVVRTVQAWIKRSDARSIRIKAGDDEIEIHGLPEADERRLIEDWLSRRTER